MAVGNEGSFFHTPALLDGTCLTETPIAMPCHAMMEGSP